MFYSFLDPLLASRRFTWEESEVICNYHGMTLASLQDDKKHFKVARLMGVLSKHKLLHFDECYAILYTLACWLNYC